MKEVSVDQSETARTVDQSGRTGWSEKPGGNPAYVGRGDLSVKSGFRVDVASGHYAARKLRRAVQIIDLRECAVAFETVQRTLQFVFRDLFGSQTAKLVPYHSFGFLERCGVV